MNLIIALAGLIAFAAVLAVLAHTLLTDGYGTRPPPRSHHGETGDWIAQQLQR
jgi:hypothetical protein